MSEIPQSAFQHVINGLSKIKHTPQNDHQLYSSAMQLLKNNFGTEDLGIVLIEALKSESPESVNNFLTQLEHSDIGVIAFGRSSSLSSALQAVIDLRGTKILNLVLEIILKSCTLSGDSSNAVVDQTGSLFEKVLRLIPSEDLTISGQACKLTESIIITSQTQQSLLAIMYSESCAYVSIEKNIFLRFANIWARILGRDDNLFNLCSTCGAAEAIVSLCRSHDDILVQIVAMELLIHFAKTSSGLQYLFSAGVIDWLVTVTSSEEDATLLGNQALRQLGDIFATSSSKNLISNKIWSAIDESIISRYMLSVRNYLDSRSEADRLTGLYALSSFASSCEGALALVMTDVTLLETWFSLLSSGKIEILTAALHSIARVLDTKSNSLEVGQGSSESKASSTTADGDVTSSVDLAALKKKIVSEIGKTKGVSAVTFLMKTARQPVNERKLAVYATMTALCRQQPGGWGLMAMYSTQGFREFIEDRDTEHTKEGKEAKFSLIKAVAENPQFIALISEDIRTAINRMVSQGAYHKSAMMEDPMVLEL